MHYTSIATVLAACLSLAVADTTTSTSTLTKTITITQCNPTVTNCPGRANSTTSTWYPVSNSTSAAATAVYSNTTTAYVAHTSTAGAVLTLSASSAPTGGNTVTTSGGNGLFVHSGLLLGAVGAGLALLA